MIAHQSIHHTHETISFVSVWTGFKHIHQHIFGVPVRGEACFLWYKILTLFIEQDKKLFIFWGQIKLVGSLLDKHRK